MAREPNAQVARRESGVAAVRGGLLHRVRDARAEFRDRRTVRAYSTCSDRRGIAILRVAFIFSRVPLPLMGARAIEVEKPVGLGGLCHGARLRLRWTPCIARCLQPFSSSRPRDHDRARCVAACGLFAGVGIPFVLAAFALKRSWRCSRACAIAGAGGEGMVDAVAYCIAFLTGWVTRASYWLLEMFRCSRIRLKKEEPAEAASGMRIFVRSGRAGELRHTCRPCPRYTRRNRGR